MRKLLKEYTNCELIEHLNENYKVDLRELAGICSEILRRMNEINPLLKEEEKESFDE